MMQADASIGTVRLVSVWRVWGLTGKLFVMQSIKITRDEQVVKP